LEKLKKLMHKPVVMKYGPVEIFAVIFAYEQVNYESMDVTGPLSERYCRVHYLDVTNTVLNKKPVYEEAEFSEEITVSEIIKETTITPEINLQIEKAIGIIVESHAECVEFMMDIQRSLSSCNVMLGGTIGVLNSEGELGGAFFSTSNLNQKQIQKINLAINNIIEATADNIDTNNEREVEQLRKQIEYAIIESLPNSSVADEIQVDMKKVLEFINQLKDEEENDDHTGS
jgi:hypothetical protein